MDKRRIDVLDSYRYLRMAPLVCVVALLVAVAGQGLGAGCAQGSISAYYFTAVHAAFVACLCAIGAVLVIYQGNSATEDVVLNISGFLAFVVALVPTARERTCGGPEIPLSFDPEPGIRNNVLALVIAAAAAEVFRLVVAQRGRVTPDRWTRLATYAGWAIVAVGLVFFFAAPQAFATYGHTVAAVAMFVGIIVVVVLNALATAAEGAPARFVRTYRAVAALMALTLVSVVVLGVTLQIWGYAVIITEVLLILEFAAFWAVQTAELWDVTDRTELTHVRTTAGDGIRSDTAKKTGP